MRRLIVATALLATLVLTQRVAGTERKPPPSQCTDDGRLVSVVNVVEPRTAGQLIRGFYPVESDSWRWTMKKFMVNLATPPDAVQRGASLELKFAIPEVIFNRLGPMAVSATINGVALPPESYSKAGDCSYIRDVPAIALSSDGVGVQFTVDKGLPPSDQDHRELAIVVTTLVSSRNDGHACGALPHIFWPRRWLPDHFLASPVHLVPQRRFRLA